MENEAFTVTLEVIVALDHLKIPYDRRFVS